MINYSRNIVWQIYHAINMDKLDSGRVVNNVKYKKRKIKKNREKARKVRKR